MTLLTPMESARRRRVLAWLRAGAVALVLGGAALCARSLNACTCTGWTELGSLAGGIVLVVLAVAGFVALEGEART